MLKVCLLICLLLVTSLLDAAELPSHLIKPCVGKDCSRCHQLSPEEATKILSKAGGAVTSVKFAPAPGMYELLVEKDGQEGLIYLDFTKKYLFQGMIISLERLEPIASHASNALVPNRIKRLDVSSIPVANTLTIGNPDGKKHLYVFTDPDCPYCRQLHGELVKLEKIAPDVAIHLLFFPLPMHPDSYDKSRAIIGGKSRELLELAFAGKDVPRPIGAWGKTQVDAIVAYAKGKGLNGTPTIVLPDGNVIVGGRDAEMLKRMLDQLTPIQANQVK